MSSRKCGSAVALAKPCRSPFSLGRNCLDCHRYCSFDCYHARAGGADGRGFCKRFGLNLTCRFSLGLLWGGHLRGHMQLLDPQRVLHVGRMGVGRLPRFVYLPL